MGRVEFIGCFGVGDTWRLMKRERSRLVEVEEA